MSDCFRGNYHISAIETKYQHGRRQQKVDGEREESSGLPVCESVMGRHSILLDCRLHDGHLLVCLLFIPGAQGLFGISQADEYIFNDWLMDLLNERTNEWMDGWTDSKTLCRRSLIRCHTQSLEESQPIARDGYPLPKMLGTRGIEGFLRF